MNSLDKKPRVFYGWYVLLIAFLGWFFSGPGQTYFISQFVDLYIGEFGWERWTVSGMYCGATMLSGLLVSKIGWLGDKYGYRKSIIATGILFGLICMFNSMATGFVMVFAGFLLSRLLGQSAMTLLPAVLIPHWFEKKRAFAFSIVSMGTVISSIVVPVINTSLLNYMDWRWLWRGWGGSLLLIFVPLAYWLLRNRPEDVCDYVDGIKPRSGMDADGEKRLDFFLTKRQALRTYSFWALMYCCALNAMVFSGLAFHMISIVGASGMTRQDAAMALSLLACISFPANFIAAWLQQYVKISHSIIFFCTTQILALFCLAWGGGYSALVMFAVFQGVTNGVQAIVNNLAWPEYFGNKHLGAIRGVALAGLVIGSALGPLPFGISYDFFGGYFWCLVLMAILPLAGVIAAIFCKPPEIPTRQSVVVRFIPPPPPTTPTVVPARVSVRTRASGRG